MPMMSVNEHSNLALLVYAAQNSFTAYIYDPSKIDYSKSVRKNFRRKDSPVHVAVICAQGFDDKTWEVTNVRAITGSKAAPLMYYIALEYLRRIRPDSVITSQRVKVIWDRLRKNPLLTSDGDVLIADGRINSEWNSSWGDSHYSILIANHCDVVISSPFSRGVDRPWCVIPGTIVDCVLSGFAVVSMDKE